MSSPSAKALEGSAQQHQPREGPRAWATASYTKRAAHGEFVSNGRVAVTVRSSRVDDGATRRRTAKRPSAVSGPKRFIPEAIEGLLVGSRACVTTLGQLTRSVQREHRQTGPW